MSHHDAPTAPFDEVPMFFYFDSEQFVFALSPREKGRFEQDIEGRNLA